MAVLPSTFIGGGGGGIRKRKIYEVASFGGFPTNPYSGSQAITIDEVTDINKTIVIARFQNDSNYFLSNSITAVVLTNSTTVTVSGVMRTACKLWLEVIEFDGVKNLWFGVGGGYSSITPTNWEKTIVFVAETGYVGNNDTTSQISVYPIRSSVNYFLNRWRKDSSLTGGMISSISWAVAEFE